jgi:hypothetical protein
MPDARQIRVNELLLEREAQFVRVYDLEQAAAKILGEPYPFTKPPLPSDQRRKAKSAPRAAAAARESLRRLEDGEAVFRISYRHSQRECVEEHDNLDALRALVAAQGARLVVDRIETLRADGTVAAVLFDRVAHAGA